MVLLFYRDCIAVCNTMETAEFFAQGELTSITHSFLNCEEVISVRRVCTMWAVEIVATAQEVIRHELLTQYEQLYADEQRVHSVGDFKRRLMKVRWIPNESPPEEGCFFAIDLLAIGEFESYEHELGTE